MIGAASGKVPRFMTFYTPDQDTAGLQAKTARREDLPQVLLIGDSISIGYTEPVCALLEGICQIERPEANCGDTRAGLAHIHSWLGDRHWDVVHFNWGLHDLCCRHPSSTVYGNRDKIHGTVSVELDAYEKNLEQLVQIIRQQSTHMIWASTTLVPEGEAGRHLGDDLRYNAVAAQVMQRHQIPCNDLHALSTSFPPALFTAPGDVHYTKDGSLKLAEAVVACVRGVLGL